MIRFKNHKPGFSLLETMLALVIVGMVLTPVFLLFSTIVQRMNKSSRSLYALVSAEQFLYEARQNQENAQTFTVEKKDEKNDFQLSYALTNGGDKKSALSRVQGLHKELITVTWMGMGKKQTEKLVTFVYKKAEQKK
jgi:prepilin-type N-terminal cleavage/methylation domain-containing protein